MKWRWSGLKNEKSAFRHRPSSEHTGPHVEAYELNFWQFVDEGVLLLLSKKKLVSSLKKRNYDKLKIGNIYLPKFGENWPK